jgi:dephospho-CoA kinase
MIIIGLTGSIGTGKTTVTRQFAECGAATLNSDAVVHALLEKGGEAVPKVAALFPGALDKDHIDRRKLGAEVFGDAHKLKRLEAIIHPLVRRVQDRFIRAARLKGNRFAVLDIPLLFETKREKRCDVTVVTTAPAYIQRKRVLMRANMTEAKFARILASQMPDAQKRRRGDFIISTGSGKAASLKAVKRIMALLSLRFYGHAEYGRMDE